MLISVIIVVVVLKVLLIVLLITRHRKRKAARRVESARVQKQIRRQMEEMNGGATGARDWEQAPPPYDPNMPRAPEVARTEAWGPK